MSPKLEAEFLQLPPSELARLIRLAMLRLSDTQALELLFKPSDTEEAEIETLWAKEAVTRLEEYRSGKVTPISGEESEKQVLEALKNVRLQRSA